MKAIKNKPFNHQFKFSGNDDDIPEDLGLFKTIEKAKAFINKYFIAETVTNEVAKRLYSEEEIAEMRLTVNAELEDERPVLEKEYLDASTEFELAKTKKNDAQEALNACISRAKNISDDIKSGWTEINLDPARSFRIAVNGKYYTYVRLDDGSLVMAKTAIIPEFELKNLFNSAQNNEQSLHELFDGKTKASKGEAK